MSRDHWETVYANANPEGVSWFQSVPAVSLDLLAVAGVAKDAAIVDIGGGSSNLVDHLLDAGFTDVTVLDVSEAALDVARRRLGRRAQDVRWICRDLLAWRPDRSYDVWHDRAVFHFLTDPGDRVRYRDVMRDAIGDEGTAIIATFAPDGPHRCSGLDVARYGTRDLLDAVGGLELIDERREEHTTPSGAVQPFTWALARTGQSTKTQRVPR